MGIVFKFMFTVCGHTEELLICQHAGSRNTDGNPRHREDNNLCTEQENGPFDREGFCAMCTEFFKPYDISHPASVERYRSFKQQNEWADPVHPSRFPHDFLFIYTLIVVPRPAHRVGIHAWAKLGRPDMAQSLHYCRGIPVQTPADFRYCMDTFRLNEDASEEMMPKRPPETFISKSCMKELPPLPL